MKKVMIVDDNKEFLEELQETLALSGYEMVAVDDASKALEVARLEKPDCIVLDLKMPGKSGFQLADELRHVSGFEGLPIIAMTGFFRDDYLPLMDICGITKYLRKPFNPLDIIASLEAVLGNGEPAR